MDFAHCPPGTAHAFVPIGDDPCSVLMVGARPEERTIVYPRSELALGHGVGVENETSSPAEAQAELGVSEWYFRRPDGWARLPWV